MPLRGSILTLADRTRDVSRRVVERVLREEGAAIVEAARARWPVKTGKSRDALALLGQGRRVVIVDRIRYARIIESNGINPWEAYVVAPVVAMVRAAAPAIARQIVDDLRER